MGATKFTMTALSSYCKMAEQYPRLTRQQEIDLGKRIQEGDEDALEEMIAANLRLVVKIANDFKNEDVSIEDLVCEGNLGLITAAKDYNPTIGTKFSSYAAWWIKAHIRRFIMEKNRTIRIPLSAISKVYKINKAREEFEYENRRSPNRGELAEASGLSVAVVDKLSECPLYFSSLEDHVGEESDAEFGEFVADEYQIGHLTDPENHEKTMILMKHIDSLSERKKNILIHRFGLDGKGKRTLDETAETIGKTRERIRQLQESILIELQEKLKEDGINHSWM